MRLPVFAFILVNLALPLKAQDIPAEFAQTYSMFTLPGSQGFNPDAALAAISSLLPTLQGDWVRGDLLSGDTGLLDAARISDACGRQAERFVLVPPHGFKLHRIKGGQEVVLQVRYDYQGLNIFQRSFEESEWLAMLGFDADRPAMPSIYYNQPRGEIFLFAPSPNVMFFQLSRGGAEFYVRCPVA